MKEISKKDLLAQVNENYGEVDELADFKKQQGIEKKWEPIMSDPQDEKGYEGSYKARGSSFRSGKAKGSHIGHKVIDKTTGEPMVIFYPCEAQIDEFVATHNAAIQALKEEYGDVYMSLSKTNPNCEPRVTGSAGLTLHNPTTGGEKFVDTRVRFETEISDANYLKRYLIYPLINEVLLGDGEVGEHLEKCNIPRIKVSDRAHLDRHSTFSNSQLTYQTLNFYSYKDVRDFFNSAVRNVQGQTGNEEIEYREYHLARQFNKLYANWEKTRKNREVWIGFTPIYNLEASGLSPQTFDVTISTLLTIRGEISNNNEGGYNFNWEASLTTEHGKKLKSNNQLKKMQMNNDENITAQKTVPVGEGVDIRTKDGIANDESVRQGLTDVLESLKRQILQIPIQSQLLKAKLTNFELSPEEKAEMRRARAERLALMSANDDETGAVDVTNEEPPLQENFINNLVMNILSEIKK